MKRLLIITLGALLLTLFSMPNTANAGFWDRFKRDKNKESQMEDKNRTQTSDEATTGSQQGMTPGQSDQEESSGSSDSSSAPQSSGQGSQGQSQSGSSRY